MKSEWKILFYVKQGQWSIPYCPWPTTEHVLLNINRRCETAGASVRHIVELLPVSYNILTWLGILTVNLNVSLVLGIFTGMLMPRSQWPIETNLFFRRGSSWIF